MRNTTFLNALATVAVLGDAMLAPELDLSPRDYKYAWQVTKWEFCCGYNDYSYSFKIDGPQAGDTPNFTASCSGIASQGLESCKVISHRGKYIPTVSAGVTIVQDLKTSNDNIPRLKVHMQYTEDEGYIYFWDGHYDATLNCGSMQGSKFTIVPKLSAVG